MSVKIDIITCPEWGARKPRHGLVLVGPAQRILVHHTAGHHREIENPRNESRAEAIRYARDIQKFHMGPSRGWIDSGHSFLVCRNGLILQGRWLTVSAIEAGHMVESAHCPGQNHQVGIEHEHNGQEAPTPQQLASSARLMAWIADQYGRRTPLNCYPHSEFVKTSCPANLKPLIPHLRDRAAALLAGL